MTKKDLSNRIQILARFAYEGQNFHGVQEQKSLKTVLGTLRERIESASGQRAKSLVCASRTDKGVHALCNYATFYIMAPVNIESFILLCEKDHNDGIINLRLSHVSPHVHARGNSRGKHYRYTIKHNVDENLISWNSHIWLIAPHLNITQMREAAKAMLGTHDFSSFRGAGCSASDPRKTIFSIEITEEDSVISINIKGNAFLRKMVRNMIGLLVEVGAGLRPVHAVSEIIAARSRDCHAITAPAWGLCLQELFFSSLAD
jgi:tRNA pseudouridine38-40 synthase